MEQRFTWPTIRGVSAATRRGLLLAALLLIMAFSAGCRYTAAPADLLKKPSIDNNRERLVEAIEKSLPRYSRLMLPHTDDYREAIRMVDLDGDGQDEAVVTYYNEYYTPEIAVLKHSDNGWRQWVLIEQPLAWDIAWIKLQDMDNSGWKELLVGWVGSMESSNVLEVYSFQTKPVRNEKGRLRLQPLQSIPYHLAETGDLDGDGLPELAVVSATTRSGELETSSYYLSVYSWSKGNAKLLDSFQLPEGVHSFERMVYGQAGQNVPGLVLEGGTGAHSMLTYMYAWEKDSLRLIYPSRIVGLDDGGFSERPTKSKDMNGDGIIELHRTREAPGNEELPYSDKPWINDWIQWNGKDGFEKVAEQYADLTYGVEMDIPESWKNNYTVMKPPKTSYGIATFFYYKDEAKRAEIATLYVVPIRQWHGVEGVWKEEGRTFNVLASSSGNMFVISFVQNAPEELDDMEKQEFESMLTMREHLSAFIRITNE